MWQVHWPWLREILLLTQSMFHVPCCFNSLISICIALRNSNLCGPPMPRRVWKYQGLLQLPCKVLGITQVCDASNCPSVQIMGPSVRGRCTVGLEVHQVSDHPGVHSSNYCVFMLLIKVELHWSPSNLAYVMSESMRCFNTP
jgi:hypothetical protein